MALGGGSFTAQDKVLPGSYINFISTYRAGSDLSQRGVAAMPLITDWGAEQEIITLQQSDFIKKSQLLFGYEYTHEKMLPLRELFKNARTVYLYRLNNSTVKASNAFAEARYGGVRGDAIKLVIHEAESGNFTVETYLDTHVIDTQTVASITELLDNDFVIWKKNTVLEETSGTPLSGGTNGITATIETYQKFLDSIEPYSFHALGCNTDVAEIVILFVDFTRRMRDKVGAKFQTVVYRAPKADYEGVVSVENRALNAADISAIVYWVTGVIAGCEVNKSNTNKVYDGELRVDTNYTQAQLEDAIQTGKFMLHRVGDEVRVLEDINSYVSITNDKGSDFQSNQTIRVLDQIGNDIAVLFNRKYLGKIANDEAGRISFWNDLVSYCKGLERIRAIENFNPEKVVVEKGEGKKSIIATCPITPTSAISQLYMTVVVL